MDRTGHIYLNIMFKTFVLLWRQPAGAFFPPKTAFPKIVDMVIFSKNEFSPKTQLFGHLFREISRKSGSYGPYGPFRFSVQSEFWYVNFHQILDFWGKPTFPDFCKNELILLGWILKPSSMSGATPQGLFVSRKYTLLEFWDMQYLHQAVFLLFVVFGSLMKLLVTKHTIIKVTSFTDYKICFCAVKPNPL